MSQTTSCNLIVELTPLTHGATRQASILHIYARSMFVARRSTRRGVWFLKSFIHFVRTVVILRPMSLSFMRRRTVCHWIC